MSFESGLDVDGIVHVQEPPKEPALSAWDWVRKNLFSSVFNGFLTVISVLLLLAAARSLLGFIFSPSRRWDATATSSAKSAIRANHPLRCASALWGLRIAALRSWPTFAIRFTSRSIWGLSSREPSSP